MKKLLCGLMIGAFASFGVSFVGVGSASAAPCSAADLKDLPAGAENVRCSGDDAGPGSSDATGGSAAPCWTVATVPDPVRDVIDPVLPAEILGLLPEREVIFDDSACSAEDVPEIEAGGGSVLPAGVK